MPGLIKPANHALWYVAQILLGGSFVIPDLLALRLCLAAGFFFLCVWSFHILDISLDSGLFAAIYCVINLTQAGFILYSRRDVKFDKDREEIYTLYFDKHKKNVYPRYSPTPEAGDLTHLGFPFRTSTSAASSSTGKPDAWIRKLPCSPVEFASLTSVAQVRMLVAGQQLAHRGDECTSLTFLLEGELSYFQSVGAPSQLHPVARSMPGVARQLSLAGKLVAGSSAGSSNSSSSEEGEYVHVHSVRRLGIVDAVEWLHRHTERGPRWGVHCRAVTAVRLLSIPYAHIDRISHKQPGLEATLTAMCGMEATRLLFDSQEEYLNKLDGRAAGDSGAAKQDNGASFKQQQQQLSVSNGDVLRGEQLKPLKANEEAELVRFHGP